MCTLVHCPAWYHQFVDFEYKNRARSKSWQTNHIKTGWKLGPKASSNCSVKNNIITAIVLNTMENVHVFCQLFPYQSNAKLHGYQEIGQLNTIPKKFSLQQSCYRRLIMLMQCYTLHISDHVLQYHSPASHLQLANENTNHLLSYLLMTFINRLLSTKLRASRYFIWDTLMQLCIDVSFSCHSCAFSNYRNSVLLLKTLCSHK